MDRTAHPWYQEGNRPGQSNKPHAHATLSVHTLPPTGPPSGSAASHLSSWPKPTAAVCLSPTDPWWPGVTPRAVEACVPHCAHLAFPPLASTRHIPIVPGMSNRCRQAGPRQVPTVRRMWPGPWGATWRIREAGSPGTGHLHSHTPSGTSCQMLMRCLSGKLKCCESPLCFLSSLERAPCTATSPRNQRSEAEPGMSARARGGLD